jgi:hypothetical protein
MGLLGVGLRMDGRSCDVLFWMREREGGGNTLHYRAQKIPGEQNADYSNEFKSNELWRVLRSPSEYRAP